MSNYNSIKAIINANVKTNGKQEISGSVLNSVLNAMVNALGVGYQFVGIATPSTNPGTPDQNVFYFAATAGTYSNFNGLVVNDGEIAILKYNGTWTKDVTGAATAKEANLLRQDVSGITDLLGATEGTSHYPLDVVIYKEGYYIDNKTGAELTWPNRMIARSVGWKAGDTIRLEYLKGGGTSSAAIALYKDGAFIKSILNGIDKPYIIVSSQTDFTPDVDFDEVRFSLYDSNLANVVGIKLRPGFVSEKIESISESISDIQALDAAVFANGYSIIADETSIRASQKWYALSKESVSESTAIELGYKGLKFPCKNGDKFIISTYGGAVDGRSYAIADEKGHIFAVASSSERDYITQPLELTISQENAACLYVNCMTSQIGSFYVKQFGKINRIDVLEHKIGINTEIKGVLLLGASFAYAGNSWFADGCKKLGLTGLNEAVSGTSILTDAHRLIQGNLFSNIEDFDILAIMHVLNYDVNSLGAYVNFTWQDYESDADFVSAAQNDTRSDTWISCAFDYILKKYAYLCYQRKDNPTSRWYNKQYGKPVMVCIFSSWHDSRQTYNDSAKTLSERWGYHFIDIASQIGFSCQKLSPATGAQPSILYAQDTQSQTFIMNGASVTQVVGWHPLRGAGSFAQNKIAKIFSDEVGKLI